MLSVSASGGIYAPILRSDNRLHENWEIIYFNSGSGYIRIGTEEYCFSSGDMFFIPPFTEYCERSDQGFMKLYIQVSDSGTFSKYVSSVFGVSDTESRDLLLLLQLIQRKYSEKNPAISGAVSLMVESLLSLACSVGGIVQQSPAIERIKSLLADNIANPTFDLASIYDDELHMNRDYLRRLFKKETGVSPGTYLKNLRISCAKSMLDDMHSRQSIKQIAAACGIPDQYYFSRLFKKETGMSPNAWRSKRQQP